MDIWLLRTEDWVNIMPTSVHGMLWLQTHFETHQWEYLASDQVKIPVSDAKMLTKDAKEAGLAINSVLANLKAKNFS